MIRWFRPIFWLLACPLLLLLVFGCSGPPPPCQGDGIGPLSGNFDGFRCKHTCECNNQDFYGVCQNGVCKVLAERPPCARASVTREVLVRNRFFAQECPSVLETQRSTCPSGAFDKVCRGEGLTVDRWANCRCVGPLCAPGKILCDSNCRPDQPCVCIDLQTNPQHCGACGRKCPVGAVCQQGRCLCPKDRTLCTTPCKKPPCAQVCADLTQDSQHCGACGKACPEGGLCAQSVCQEVPLQAGAYWRGTPDQELDWNIYSGLIGIQRFRETPHFVLLTRPFFMGRQEVTRGWFRQVMGYDPSDWKCAGDFKQCPVHHVTFYQAMDFCNQLSKQRGLETCYVCDKHSRTPDVTCAAKPEFRDREIYRCQGYRLPTDAEWGYAVRAGTRGVFHEHIPEKLPLDVGSQYLDLLGPIAWYVGNANDVFHPVATKKPNPWGLYDMLGNAAEWVWEKGSRMNEHTLVDPYGDHFDPEKVYRGGHIFLPPMLVRNGFRGTEQPTLKDATDPALVSYYGFRIARTSPNANEACSRVNLSACGSFGCKDTRGDAEHCGVCGRKCPEFYVCQDGLCVVPEVEVPTRQKDGTPIVWQRGFHNPKALPGEIYCAWRDATPHKAQFLHRYLIQRFEVRQRDYEALLGYNPSRFKTCPDCPVESVTWFQALAYANALSKHKGLEPCYLCTGDIKKPDEFHCTLKPKFAGNNGQDYTTCLGYRLPTEAEWEFAALATGKRRNQCNTDEWIILPYREAWHGDNAGARTRPVGTKPGNELGIHDLLGNVMEWAWDAYAPYEVDPTQKDKVYTNPIGRLPVPSPQTCNKCDAAWDEKNKTCAPCFRVRKGGWYLKVPPRGFDETERHFTHMTKLYYDSNGHLETPSANGFRLVRTLPAKEKR